MICMFQPVTAHGKLKLLVSSFASRCCVLWQQHKTQLIAGTARTVHCIVGQDEPVSLTSQLSTVQASTPRSNRSRFGQELIIVVYITVYAESATPGRSHPQVDEP